MPNKERCIEKEREVKISEERGFFLFFLFFTFLCLAQRSSGDILYRSSSTGFGVGLWTCSGGGLGASFTSSLTQLLWCFAPLTCGSPNFVCALNTSPTQKDHTHIPRNVLINSSPKYSLFNDVLCYVTILGVERNHSLLKVQLLRPIFYFPF